MIAIFVYVSFMWCLCSICWVCVCVCVYMYAVCLWDMYVVFVCWLVICSLLTGMYVRVHNYIMYIITNTFQNKLFLSKSTYIDDLYFSNISNSSKNNILKWFILKFPLPGLLEILLKISHFFTQPLKIRANQEDRTPELKIGVILGCSYTARA